MREGGGGGRTFHPTIRVGDDGVPVDIGVIRTTSARETQGPPATVQCTGQQKPPDCQRRPRLQDGKRVSKPNSGHVRRRVFRGIREVENDVEGRVPGCRLVSGTPNTQGSP